MDNEILRRMSLFAELNEEDLTRLRSMMQEETIAAGDWLMREGESGDTCYIILEGRFEVTKRLDQQEVVLAERAAGEVVGEIALLGRGPRVASVRATEASRVLSVSQAAFQQLVTCSPDAAISMFDIVSRRLRNLEAAQMQQAKMASLGTLAAGLAHELNNPASALQRSNSQQREVLNQWQRLTIELESSPLDDVQRNTLVALRERIMSSATERVPLDPDQRLDREQELEEWLDEHEIEESWELAPTLVQFQWAVHEMDELARLFPAPQLNVVLHWIGQGCTLYNLLEETGHSVARIVGIVTAVKRYSYLDQAPVQEVDIHEGLDNTLMILRHKIGDEITINKTYAPDLPRIEAYAGELNQVWTNIIDNALDAINGSGELSIRTYPKRDQVVVEIGDNGPGMPAELVERIFDPFFTTKPVGSGTGLGLHIVRNIIYHHHRGDIKVSSEPGWTCFQITLPVRMDHNRHGLSEATA